MSFDEAFKSVLISKQAKISLRQNHLVINQSENEAKLYLKDIAFVICESPHITITSALLSAFAKYKIILLICDESHIINGIFTPFLGHFKSAKLAKEQLGTKPQKRAILWQKIIKNKIINQAKVLETQGFQKECNDLISLAKIVALNDSKNIEANAAALYFKTLFGKNFSRNNPNIINSMLNYGYAILRACVIRAVCVSGLLSWAGIKHSNIYNEFNLCDDLMEVFRPFVDICVLDLCKQNRTEFTLSKDDKKALIENLQYEVNVGTQRFTLNRGVNRFVQSFRAALLGDDMLVSVDFVN